MLSVTSPELLNTPGGFRQHLIDRGMIFLAMQPPPRSFVFVWLSMWRHGVVKETLAAIAQRFLDTAGSDHPRRAVIARAVGSTRGLTESEWAPAWARQYEKELSIEGVISIATADEGLVLLRSSYDHVCWGSVFLRLWQEEFERDQLKALGHEWLALHPEGRRAREVYLALGLEAPPNVPLKKPEKPHRRIRHEHAHHLLVNGSILLEAGSRVEGVVLNITDYGIFICLGSIDGLLHISQLPDAQAADPYSFCSIGQRLKLVVMWLDAQSGRAMLALDEPVIDALPQQAIEKFREGEERTGAVVKAMRHGVYVELDEVIGFLPSANLPSDAPPNKSFRKGQTVSVRVLSVEKEHQRVILALSSPMAALNPSAGAPVISASQVKLPAASVARPRLASARKTGR